MNWGQLLHGAILARMDITPTARFPIPVTVRDNSKNVEIDAITYCESCKQYHLYLKL